MRVATGSYVGNGGASQVITSLGFAPNFVFVQDAAFDGCVYSSTSHPANKTSVPWTGTANEAGDIISLDSNGFTVGLNAKTGANTKTYYYIAIKDDSGGEVHIGTYVGNGSAGHSITGVTFQPDFVMTKGDNGTVGVIANSSMTAGTCVQMDNGTPITTGITGFGSDGFTVGTSLTANENLKNYYYIAFKARASTVAVGAYVGNSTSGRVITTNFQPAVVLINKYAGTSSNGTYSTSGFPAGDAESFGPVGFSNTQITALSSTSFTLGNATEVNGANTESYAWLAFKNNPAATTKVSTLSILGAG